MRASEFITELLDSSGKWSRTSTSAAELKYAWTIDGLHYTLDAERDPNEITTWFVEFKGIDQTTNEPTIELTDTGNALQVFATIIDIIINDVIPTVDPAVVQFGAATRENGQSTGRASLYYRLIYKYMPSNYTLEVQSVIGHVIYQIIKKQEAEK